MNRPPQISGFNYVKEILRFKEDPLQSMMHLNRNYGDMVYFGGPLKTLFLFNPRHIKEIFVDEKKNIQKGDQGKLLKIALGKGLLVREQDEWRDRRKLISRVFHHKEIDTYEPIITELTQKFLNKWKGSGPVNLTEELGQLTFEIAGSLFLGGVPDNLAVRFNKAVLNIGKIISDMLSSPIKIPLWVATENNITLKNEISFIDDFIYKQINKRRREGANGSSLIDRLISAEEPLSDLEIRDELVTFLVAGYETTAAFLTWSLYCLLKFPKHQSSFLNSKDNLQIRRAYLHEVLRLYPSVPLISRQCTEDLEIDGYKIKKGTNFVVSPYVIHRNYNLWDKPEEYNPNRFEDKDKSKDKYIPFSWGPKRCIGEELSYREVETILFHLFENSKIQLITKEMIPVCKIALYTDRSFYCEFT